ncbi:hypothetical protein [Aliihoeflea sp. PC F10.4]
MSLAVWPNNLQFRPRRDAFRLLEPHVPPQETEYEGGARRRRQAATVSRQLYAFAWDWSDAEYQAFRTFYHRTLVSGAKRFQMPAAPDYAVRTCLFKGMYASTKPGRDWRVTAELFVFGVTP